MTVTQSTTHLKAKERFAFWQDVACQTYVRVQCELSGDRPFNVHVAQTDIGNLKFTDHRCNIAMRYTRQAQDFREDACSDFQFMLLESGTAHVTQEGRQALLNAGDMVIYEASRPFTVDFPAQHKSLNFKIPHHLLSPRLTHASELTAITLKGSSPVGQMAAAAIRHSGRLQELPTFSAQNRAGTSLLDMLTTALDVELNHYPTLPTRHQQLLTTIKLYMMDNLDDAEMNIERIAQRHNVTARTINRLFAQDGTTAIRWLWQQRLNTSHKALCDGHFKQVTDAALSCGFSDFSHFSRSFKKAFGVCPHTLIQR
ncbi:helix-turn-helix domain-containing protein [Pseudomonas gingeri]|uniref:Helix-turn-helix domain-containing protein n=1 Tax=Pseudomonas gingeri TaxID=117681 RepID=A0A7Y7X9J4_9PSED|nr:helix-turn-helix domain-containing protein [Pseudomonas gingeri]NWA28662.1 helix-turn-helix domain-containing protein [Pseudomonas gingeri]NWB95739.1 helix-turn-helix domain-containing protein [Pseudomonas gingeri]